MDGCFSFARQGNIVYAKHNIICASPQHHCAAGTHRFRVSATYGLSSHERNSPPDCCSQKQRSRRRALFLEPLLQHRLCLRRQATLPIAVLRRQPLLPVSAPGGGRKRCVSNPCPKSERKNAVGLWPTAFLWLRNKDSNLDRQIQRLQCYPYTIPHYSAPRFAEHCLLYPLCSICQVFRRDYFLKAVRSPRLCAFYAIGSKRRRNSSCSLDGL